MSWADYTRASHFFGTGIFRPYSDLVAEVVLTFDNLIASEPSFARHVGAMHNRDTIIVHGESFHLLMFSRSMSRHYPLYSLFGWSDFATGSEEGLVGYNRSGVFRVANDSLDQHLTSDHLFHDPLVIAVPAAATDAKFDLTSRQSILQMAAQLLWDWERPPYDEMELASDF